MGGPAHSATSRVTRPDRRFGPDELRALPRDQRRKLAQVLLTDGAAHVVEFQSTAAHDEFVLEAPLLWRPRRVRVRIAAQPVDAAALERLSEAVSTAGDAEGLMIAAVGGTAPTTVPSGVMLVEPADFIARLERSASIAWPDRLPRPSYDRVQVQRDLERDAFLLDPVGLRWLPSLALHELPAELAGTGIAPEDLFERVAFRLMSSSLRFGGERFGEAARGQRLPDAVLRWPGSRRRVALMDCKATSSGYTMDSDHFLRFVDYVEVLREDVQRGGHELRYMLIVSSAFPGSAGARHPFQYRASALRERTGLQLVYLRAEDLARTATRIEALGLSPAAREQLDWATAFDRGLVEPDHLDAMLAG
jgi:hypothetical protein